MPIQPAHNPFNAPTLARPQGPPFGSGSQNPIATNPLFGRPIWSYTDASLAPRQGPQPRLSMGTGRTGVASSAGTSGALPGYVSQPAYTPTIPDYQPANQQAFEANIPRTIMTGNNGRELVGTYEPHDFTPGQRFLTIIRSAPNWQVMQYPPDFRNLLAWQQVMRYRIASLTVSARPLDSSMYFLGYQTNPQVSAAIGQSTLGYMGSL